MDDTLNLDHRVPEREDGRFADRADVAVPDDPASTETVLATAPAPPPSAAARSPLSRRRRLVLGVAGAAALVSVGGLVGAAFVQSPAQVAADAAPPRPQWLTAPVARHVLSSTLIVRGTVSASASVTVEAAAASAQGAAVQVVTAVRVKAGDVMRPGQVVADISGRPVMLLPGTTPAYRDLKPGATGDDVAELQDALKKLGFAANGDTRGTFGTATKKAVTDLYAHLGYEVPTTGGPGDAGDKQSLAAARTAVQTAQRAVDDMKLRIAAGGPGAQTQPGQESLSVQLSYLRQALTASQQDLASLEATTGPMMPLGEFVYVPDFPARVATVPARVGAPGTGPLATLSLGDLGVQVQLQPDQAQLVKPGMRVDLLADELGLSAEGTVGTVGAVTTEPPGGGDASGSSGQQPAGGGAQQVAPYVPVTVVPSASLASAWSGHDVRVTITSAATAGPVLVVPVAAVSSGADGRDAVEVLAAGSAPTRVPVVTGLSADGYIEVRPVDPGALRENDAVVIGR